jgi:adenine-specific DNA-methyltransferase
MKNRKKSGSFYTPEYLSMFMMQYISSNFEGIDKFSIFEPSVGDGSFVKAFNKVCFSKTIKSFSFTAIDKIKPELRKAQEAAFLDRKNNTRYSFSHKDFLKYQFNLNKKFHLVIGNPPYIKKGLLNKVQINLCKEIHDSAKLSNTTIKNIWAAFLVRCSRLLEENGVLALVLPAELLQVKFASELRNFLKEQFQRTEVFTFDDLLFECKGQDTIVLIAFKKHRQPGQFFTHVGNVEDLKSNNFVLTQNIGLTTTNSKWSHHLLSSDELIFIHNIGDRLNKIDHYCESKPGIVSAANNYFIVNEETEREYSLGRHTRPIIQKGFYVNGSVVFDLSDFKNLVEEGKRTKILCFNDSDKNLNERVEEYLKIGKKRKLHNRYKCKIRSNWYVVPNISTVPEGFFFKRSHQYPKLLKNNAEVLVTDSAYKIEMRDGFNINHLIYSFYNSLTLTFAELNGRYYGGGVLELTPSEFKGLPIPNVGITARDFNAYTREFENKNGILDVLNANDFQILNTALNLSEEEIVKIKSICKKLIEKRVRKKT